MTGPFITLTRRDDGRPIYLHVDHVVPVEGLTDDQGQPCGQVCTDAGDWIAVRETPERVVALVTGAWHGNSEGAAL